MDLHTIVDSQELRVNETAKDFLKESARWASFLSILGFIGIGFMVVLALFAGTMFANVGNPFSAVNSIGSNGSPFGIIFSVLYLVIAGLYFFPVYYLNRFASNVKIALEDNNTDSLAVSFEYLKSHYKFIGILMVVIFSLYALVFAGMFMTMLGKIE